MKHKQLSIAEELNRCDRIQNGEKIEELAKGFDRRAAQCRWWQFIRRLRFRCYATGCRNAIVELQVRRDQFGHIFTDQTCDPPQSDLHDAARDVVDLLEQDWFGRALIEKSDTLKRLVELVD